MRNVAVRQAVALLVAAAAVAVPLAGCADPAADKPKAVVSDPTPTPPPDAPPAEAASEERYVLTDATQISFIGSKVTGSHDGGFREFDGEIVLVNGDPSGSRVDVTIDANSLWADNERLTEHLKSADFFDVATFPQVRFTSSSVERDGEGNQYKVTGNLTMHGITRTVTFPATIDVVPGESVRAHAEFAIKRFDFGIMYKGKADDLIRDDVVIKLDLDAAPASGSAEAAAQL